MDKAAWATQAKTLAEAVKTNRHQVAMTELLLWKAGGSERRGRMIFAICDLRVAIRFPPRVILLSLFAIRAVVAVCGSLCMWVAIRDASVLSSCGLAADHPPPIRAFVHAFVDVWACGVLLAAVWVLVEWFCIADCLSFAFGLWYFVFGPRTLE